MLGSTDFSFEFDDVIRVCIWSILYWLLRYMNILCYVENEKIVVKRVCILKYFKILKKGTIPSNHVSSEKNRVIEK